MDKCDIIISVWNELENTKACFESLKRTTEYPYRLVVIDNGSEESTRRYLETCVDKFPAYRLIRFETNLGFVKAVNSGLKAVDATYICLLNNDTILTAGWLSEMVSVMADERIGALNPASNNWGEWPPDDDIERFSSTLSSRKGTYQETSYCIGFCMLIRKKIVEQIGYLDESYGLGYLEETDYCRRLQGLGYICAWSKGAYVYHLGGQSFKRLGNARLLYENNLRLFNQRWGRSLRIAYLPYDNEEPTSLAGELILAALRDYNSVTIYAKPTKKGFSFLPDHASLKLCVIGGGFFGIKVFFRIVSRQLKWKKGKDFDLILVRRSLLGWLLKKLEFLHRAKVMI